MKRETQKSIKIFDIESSVCSLRILGVEPTNTLINNPRIKIRMSRKCLFLGFFLIPNLFLMVILHSELLLNAEYFNHIRNKRAKVEILNRDLRSISHSFRFFC